MINQTCHQPGDQENSEKTVFYRIPNDPAGFWHTFFNRRSKTYYLWRMPQKIMHQGQSVKKGKL